LLCENVAGLEILRTDLRFFSRPSPMRQRNGVIAVADARQFGVQAGHGLPQCELSRYGGGKGRLQARTRSKGRIAAGIAGVTGGKLT
jgi:hypothetical protein